MSNLKKNAQTTILPGCLAEPHSGQTHRVTGLTEVHATVAAVPSMRFEIRQLMLVFDFSAIASLFLRNTFDHQTIGAYFVAFDTLKDHVRDGPVGTGISRLIDGDDISFFITEVASGCEIHPHYHRDDSEIYFVIRGKG